MSNKSTVQSEFSSQYSGLNTITYGLYIIQPMAPHIPDDDVVYCDKNALAFL